MLPTGQQRSNRRTKGGFTLLELILVMALLLIVMAVAFPMLQDFFRGRNLDSEARRLLALSRYGQSRAVSEGIPMVLWFDRKDRSYGLRAMEGYLDHDDKQLEYTLRKDCEIEIGGTFARENPWAANAATTSASRSLQSSKSLTSGLEQIEFNPDGFISERSPNTVTFVEKDFEISISLNTNRLNYVIATNELRRSNRK